jgi:hypothetical protein
MLQKGTAIFEDGDVLVLVDDRDEVVARRKRARRDPIRNHSPSEEMAFGTCIEGVGVRSPSNFLNIIPREACVDRLNAETRWPESM